MFPATQPIDRVLEGTRLDDVTQARPPCDVVSVYTYPNLECRSSIPAPELSIREGMAMHALQQKLREAIATGVGLVRTLRT
jgi:hypothetical protein